MKEAIRKWLKRKELKTMKCPKCGREMKQTLDDPFSYFCRYCCKVWELKEKKR
jgi:endogenous inhibitor of DNA gyrase (YacG/DUF329 family)